MRSECRSPFAKRCSTCRGCSASARRHVPGIHDETVALLRRRGRTDVGARTETRVYQRSGLGAVNAITATERGGVSQVNALKRAQRLLVDVEPPRLVYRLSIPVQSQPCQIVHDPAVRVRQHARVSMSSMRSSMRPRPPSASPGSAAPLMPSTRFTLFGQSASPAPPPVRLVRSGPPARADSHAPSIAYTLPICIRPDGVGANRPITTAPRAPSRAAIR